MPEKASDWPHTVLRTLPLTKILLGFQDYIAMARSEWKLSILVSFKRRFCLGRPYVPVSSLDRRINLLPMLESIERWIALISPGLAMRPQYIVTPFEKISPEADEYIFYGPWNKCPQPLFPNQRRLSHLSTIPCCPRPRW